MWISLPTREWVGRGRLRRGAGPGVGPGPARGQLRGRAQGEQQLLRRDSCRSAQIRLFAAQYSSWIVLQTNESAQICRNPPAVRGAPDDYPFRRNTRRRAGAAVRHSHSMYAMARLPQWPDRQVLCRPIRAQLSRRRQQRHWRPRLVLPKSDRTPKQR